ncbi:MAG: UDP-N-acetylglucosamine 2-epimerase (non-hydrolyzing) [Cyclobacteriaceae bacterium]|nr:UDP-N-acetylglucosamine 2-epimerase (non-hydrolyzing) [Cyclobacteriaceae bacterium]
MKIVTIIGARPQFIKAATVSRECKKSSVNEIIVHTGQHFDANMSDVFFKEMDIPTPNYHLEINSLGHGAMTGRMLEKIEEVLISEKPNAVLVYGDTNSTLAGALAASKIHIPIAHVEAGLRSFDMNMPEEVNRILTDRISRWLFCPTATAVNNLVKEGYKGFGSLIEQPGDVMYDAVMFYKQKAKENSTVVKKESLKENGFALVTLHRAENTNDPERLKSICRALNEIHKTVPVVMPLHPRTKSFLKSLNINLDVKIIDPVGYFDMLSLLDNCRLVLTDSGGLQKEAYFFNKFCITLRDQTEWVELIEAGANELAGADDQKILSIFNKNKDRIIKGEPLYGHGNAAEKIVASLKKLI